MRCPIKRGHFDEAFVHSLPWEGVIDLEQLLRYALPAYGGDTLLESTKGLLREPSEAEVVHVLAGELRERLRDRPDAVFDEPIRLYFTEPADWDDADQAEFGDRPILPRVGNGMHRIAAALVAGARRALVTLASPPDSDDDELVEVRFRPVYDSLTDDEAADLMFSWLRSFRLTPDVWVEAHSQGSSNGVSECLYGYCPHRLRLDLEAAVHERAAARGLHLEDVTSRAVTWRQLELEDPVV